MAHLDGEDLAAMEDAPARVSRPLLAKDDGAWRRLCERDDLVTRCSRPEGDPNKRTDAPDRFGSWKHLYASAATDRRARRSAARESEYYRTINRWLMALVNLDDAEAEEKRVREERRRVVENTTGRVERMLAGTVPIRDDRDGPEERAIRTGQDALRALDVHLTTVVRKMARLREEERTTQIAADRLLASSERTRRANARGARARPVDMDPSRSKRDEASAGRRAAEGIRRVSVGLGHRASSARRLRARRGRLENPDAARPRLGLSRVPLITRGSRPSHSLLTF